MLLKVVSLDPRVVACPAVRHVSKLQLVRLVQQAQFIDHLVKILLKLHVVDQDEDAVRGREVFGQIREVVVLQALRGAKDDPSALLRDAADFERQACLAHAAGTGQDQAVGLFAFEASEHLLFVGNLDAFGRGMDFEVRVSAVVGQAVF